MLPWRPFLKEVLLIFLWKNASVKEETMFKSSNTKRSILLYFILDIWFFYYCSHQIFSFTFVDLYLKSLYHMQRGRFRPIIVRIYQHQQQQMRQLAMEQFFVPIFLLHKIWSCLARKRLRIHQDISEYLTKSFATGWNQL